MFTILHDPTHLTKITLHTDLPIDLTTTYLLTNILLKSAYISPFMPNESIELRKHSNYMNPILLDVSPPLTYPFDLLFIYFPTYPTILFLFLRSCKGL